MMTPENQRIFQILQPVLAENGLTWNQIILADDADAKDNCYILLESIVNCHEIAHKIYFNNIYNSDTVGYKDIVINIDYYINQIDAVAYARKLRKTLMSDVLYPDISIRIRHCIMCYFRYYRKILTGKPV